MKAKSLTTIIIVFFFGYSVFQTCIADYMVKAIYFVPADAVENHANEQELIRLLEDARFFFSEQMQQHGYGRQTFDVETDAQGQIVLHRVKGRFTHEFYGEHEFRLLEELPSHLVEDNAPLIFLEGSDVVGGTCGFGGFTYNQLGATGSIAVVPAFGHCIDGISKRSYVPHELGHAFGLQHDFRSESYIMSYGAHANKLSEDAAKWLSVSPYFNRFRRKNNAPTVGQIQSPRYVDDDVVVSASFSDADGLHQVMLLVDGDLRLSKSVTGVSSDVSFTVPLERDIVYKIKIQVADTYGNYRLVEIGTTIVDKAEQKYL